MSTITKTTAKVPTIVFGGAFNPPTIAHEQMLAVCVEIARKKGADIWILPSGERADKTIGVPTQHRLKYLDAMIRDVEHVGVSIDIQQYELTKNELINTFDTAKYFIEEYPQRDFLWVFGADSIGTMCDWPGGSWLKNNIRKIVFERDGASNDSLDDPLAEMYTIQTTNISSTELRRRITAGEDYSDIVGENVYVVLQS